MSTTVPDPGGEGGNKMTLPVIGDARNAAKQQRVLACVLCQHRKVKCDRKTPCTNCVKASAQCVPASAVPRQRKRRFPERDLLDRLRRYEGLLRQHHIDFEPMHTNALGQRPLIEDDTDIHPSDDARPEGSTADSERSPGDSTEDKSEKTYEAKSMWSLMNKLARDANLGQSLQSVMKVMTPREYNDDDDASDAQSDDAAMTGDHREQAIKKAFEQVYGNNDHLLFGLGRPNVDISTLHPGQAHIFRLWQVYLDNVEPLLKLVHVPTFQTRIIDAASDVTKVEPTFAALMFGIYCCAIMTLTDDECHAMFGSPRHDLLSVYQYSCQQALLNCEFIKSGMRESLTAFFLYLVSVARGIDPRSLSNMMSIAMRTAQRIGIHNQATVGQQTPLEAEMCRRLWWSLVMFDHRACERAEYRTSNLIPTWNCRIPLNIHDFEFRPEMSKPPTVHEQPTEAIFVVVRATLGQCIRHSAFHLDFINPSLKAMTENPQQGPVPGSGDLVALSKLLEEKYLRYCNPENPLHFMTIWSTRGFIARSRLLEYYARFGVVPQTEGERNSCLDFALEVLDCDTKLLNSPLTKGYKWYINLYFPFPSYFHVVQYLKLRPTSENARKCWQTMGENFEIRFTKLEFVDPITNMLFKTILQAWRTRVATHDQSDKPLEPPKIILDIQQSLGLATPSTSSSEQPDFGPEMDLDNFMMPGMMQMPNTLKNSGIPGGACGQDYLSTTYGSQYEITGQATVDPNVNNYDWTQLDWSQGRSQGG